MHWIWQKTYIKVCQIGKTEYRFLTTHPLGFFPGGTLPVHPGPPDIWVRLWRRLWRLRRLSSSIYRQFHQILLPPSSTKQCTSATLLTWNSFQHNDSPVVILNISIPSEHLAESSMISGCQVKLKALLTWICAALANHKIAFISHQLENIKGARFWIKDENCKADASCLIVPT